MNEKKFVVIKARPATRDALRILAALRCKPMVATLEQIVSAALSLEYLRLEQSRSELTQSVKYHEEQ